MLLQGLFLMGVGALVFCSPVIVPVRVRLLVAEPDSDRITYGRWRPQTSESNINGFVQLFARGSSSRRTWPEDTISNVITSNGYSGRRRPTPRPTTPPVPEGPSPCVWAIVSCCTPGSENVHLGCFQALGCSGPFWDGNPCELKMGQAAISSAQKHFGVPNATESEYDIQLGAFEGL